MQKLVYDFVHLVHKMHYFGSIIYGNILEVHLNSNYVNNTTLGNHLFDGFAPPRTNNYCKWFVNAKNYFNGLLAIIPKANHQVSTLECFVYNFV